MDTPKSVYQNQSIILFDGICNLCTGWVSFVYKRDECERFKFVSVQSDLGKELLTWCGLLTDNIYTMVYIENEHVFIKSNAFLNIIKWLVFPWSVVWKIGEYCPKPIRDWLYDRIALNRYRLFGKRTECMIPDAQLASRFL